MKLALGGQTTAAFPYIKKGISGILDYAVDEYGRLKRHGKEGSYIMYLCFQNGILFYSPYNEPWIYVNLNTIKKYFKDNGLTNALVTLEADFDPFQANTLSVIDNVFTQQFTHSRMFEGDYWFLANKKQKGIKEYYNDNNQGSHYITSFFNDISKLREGTYIWNGKEWILKEDEK